MKTIEVVAAVIKVGDEVFVTRRDYGDFENMWEFPGGKVEAGESKEAALTWVPADIAVVEKIKEL